MRAKPHYPKPDVSAYNLALAQYSAGKLPECSATLEEARQNYGEALALAERAGEAQLILPCYDGLATICLDRGDRTRAAEYMEKARKLCDVTGLDHGLTALPRVGSEP